MIIKKKIVARTRRVETILLGVRLTKLGLLLLVSLAGLDTLLSVLGLGNGLLDGDEPAITLSQGLSLEGVLVAVDLEGEGNSTILGKVGGVGL